MIKHETFQGFVLGFFNTLKTLKLILRGGSGADNPERCVTAGGR
jgi:hypothetical protein